MASGGLILQGNPDDLITSFSVIGNDENVDVSGVALEPEGTAVKNIEVELISRDTQEVIGITTTDEKAPDPPEGKPDYQ